MSFFGIIIHHSVCPSINGKGYDFFIAKDGTMVPGSDRADPNYIHICLEGDFNSKDSSLTLIPKEQLFLFHKLILHLSETIGGFSPEHIFPHTVSCPGASFPWSELVISFKDGYH